MTEPENTSGAHTSSFTTPRLGRPSSYTDEKAAIICERIIDGESLRKICSDDDMPSKKTVLKWLIDNETFRTQYARAREAQMEAYAEEILEISDDGSCDTIIDAEGNERVNQEVLGRSRLRVDSRKWLMSKLAPKKYGDKLELGGSVGIRHEDALSELE